MQDLIPIITALILLAVGFFSGVYVEKKHYESIKERERQTLHVPVVTFGAKQALPEAGEAQMFVGSVVISSDYFKTFVLALRNLVGGRVVVYESLLDRGRREAILRMKEEAIAWGATQVLNLRLETSTIGGNSNKGTVSIEVIAYGTGVR
ncbi:MAG: YbjQ family protein [Okeania sp. SIO2H7]|nr:YbjQ family protein [Okeania sp. SIO2H7]